MNRIILSLMIMCTTGLNVFASVDNGTQAPNFTLADSNGQSHSLSDFQGKFVVLEWVNPECPFVVKHYSSGNMPNLQKTYTDKGVVWLTINSSAPGKQGSFSPAEINAWAKKENAKATAHLIDNDGKIGNLYSAKTTPHMYIIDPKGTLIYQGAIDSIASADQEDIKKAENYVQTSLDAAMAGTPIVTAATKSYGCSVKY